MAVSTENVDIVVKAPRTPAPSNRAVVSLTRLAAANAVSAPRSTEPIRFTDNVAQGKASEGKV